MYLKSLNEEIYEKLINELSFSNNIIEDMRKVIKELEDKLKIDKMEMIVCRSGLSPYEIVVYQSPEFDPFSTTSYFEKRIDISPREYSICRSYKKVKKNKWIEYDTQVQENVMKLLLNFLRKYQLQQQLERQKITDLLTNYVELRGFEVFLQEIIKKNRGFQYAIVYFDIKRFKLINNEYGYNAGTAALAMVAEKVASFLKVKKKETAISWEWDCDQMLGRISADKFLALVKKNNLDHLVSLLSRLEVSFGRGDSKMEKRVLSANIGIYLLDGRDQHISQIMEKVFVAGEIAKNKEDIDVYYYDEEAHRCFLKEKEIADKMEMALYEEEFKVLFHPKVDLRTQTLSGAEALVRWKHVDSASYEPMTFLEIFEKSGFICEVDFYVFEEVCKRIREWIDDGIEPVVVSSNFSRMHLKHENFPYKIFDIQERYRVPGRYLEIEFTETAYTDEDKRMNDVADLIRSRGLRLAIDDFGSGYASLSLLADMDVDVLKIDRSLIYKGLTSEREKIVMQSISDMAHSLGVDTVCEGVENKIQANFLKSIHCYIAQGYLYDRPLEYEEFRERLITKQYEDHLN